MHILDNISNRLNLSPTKRKVIRNIVWAVIGKVVTLLGGLLVGIFVARYLGPEQYGLMSYVLSYIAIFQVLAYFGMDNIEIREESKTPEEKDKIIGTAICLKLIFAVATIGLVALTVCIFEADSFTRWMIMLYSISMIANSFGVIRNYFTSLVWNEYIVKTEITRTFIGAGIKVALLLLHASLAWFIAATLFDTMLIAGGYLVSYRSKIDSIRKWRFDKTTAIYLIKQSFPLLLSGAAVVVYTKIDQVIIRNLLNTESVGYYSVADRFVEICLFIPTILSQTITPILVQAYSENKSEYDQKSQQFMNIMVWSTLILCVVICLIALPMVRYTFGTQYLLSVPILQIMVFKVVGYALAQSSGAMIIVESKQKYTLFRNIIGCVACIVLNYLLIPNFGLKGAAYASILTSICAGYLSHLIIPQYRYLFTKQTRSLFIGWKDLTRIGQHIKVG
jgi:O-antigen/teichoic acid export membrane protein